MKTICILLGLCMLLSCSDQSYPRPRDMFIGSYRCTITQRYLPSPCSPSSSGYSFFDTIRDEVVHIEPYGDNGILFPLKYHRVTDVEQLICNNFDNTLFIDTFNNPQSYKIYMDDPQYGRAASIGIFRRNDTIIIHQSDGHSCRQSIYEYIFRGVKIK